MARVESIRLFQQHHDLIFFDSTYKTNRYRMPLLNIGGVSGNHETLSFAICFLSSEETADYNWAMQQLVDIMQKHHIPVPSCVITDREIALMTAFESSFPLSKHMLCQWHVAMNVLAKTKKYFPPLIRVLGQQPQRHPSFEAFLKEWEKLLKASTLEEFQARLDTFQNGNHPRAAVDYAIKTWLVWKEKLVSYWTDQYPHFGNKTTSRLEGLHAIMKQYIRVSTADLKGVFEKLQLFWDNQYRDLNQRLADQRNRRVHASSNEIFDQVRDIIHDKAIVLIWNEVSKLPENGPPTSTCSGYTGRVLGLPCQHSLWGKISSSEAIQPSEVHPFWHISRETADTNPDWVALGVIREPGIARVSGRPKETSRRGRHRGGGRGGASGTSNTINLLCTTKYLCFFFQERNDIRLLSNFLRQQHLQG
jgi:hypothetical protein